ncbi:MAG TPA: hypothetical protein GX709_01940 [Clostridiales bacterium]|nr:hypothetical protein [Clostridiales bacterium]
MGFANEFVILLKGLTLEVVLLLILGVALIIFEMARPSFGICATIGAALYILGMVMRVAVKDGNALAQIFFLLFFAMILILAFFIGSLMTFKKAWLYRSHISLCEESNAEGDDQMGVCIDIPQDNKKHKKSVIITDSVIRTKHVEHKTNESVEESDEVVFEVEDSSEDKEI